MRKNHLQMLTKTPIKAQGEDPLILKMDAALTWFQIFLDIQITSMWKEIPDTEENA